MAIPTLEQLDILHRNVCYAFADPKRLQIMYALDDQPRNVTALADLLAMPQPTVSRHLTVLRQRNLVIGTRDGNSITYRLADERIIGILATMRSVLDDLLAKQTQTLSQDS